MLDNVEVLCHSSIRINRKVVIYFDPYKINKNYKDADIIFITHSHYDHYSLDDIDKVSYEKTVIVVPKSMAKDIDFNKYNVILVEPNSRYNILGINIDVVRSYNINKDFHPKDNNWVGYVIELDGYKYYVAGDTDITSDNKNISCDVAFLPIGGTYTMNYKEASTLANIIKPKVVVPIHYGLILGKKEDAVKFRDGLDKDIDCKIMI